MESGFSGYGKWFFGLWKWLFRLWEVVNQVNQVMGSGYSG
jgi:hypothetical protein